MVNVRPPTSIDPPLRRSRLNVLLTEDRPQATEHWTVQLSRLLEPQGVASYLVRSGDEALELTQRVEIHAAVIDLNTPRSAGMNFAHAAGELWLIELLRRLPNRPPIVLVRSPAFSRSDVDRLLAHALRLGAFSVLNKPLDLERILAVFQRLLDRRYQGSWPLPPNP